MIVLHVSSKSNTYLLYTDENLVTKIISNLKSSHSRGHDQLSNMVVKLISSHIGKSLTLIINQSLYTGIFPDSMKIAKVVPIFKKDDKSLMNNYRPISVLPALSKVFEKVLQRQITDYFNTNNLVSPQQFGIFYSCNIRHINTIY